MIDIQPFRFRLFIKSIECALLNDVWTVRNRATNWFREEHTRRRKSCAKRTAYIYMNRTNWLTNGYKFTDWLFTFQRAHVEASHVSFCNGILIETISFTRCIEINQPLITVDWWTWSIGVLIIRFVTWAVNVLFRGPDFKRQAHQVEWVFLRWFLKMLKRCHCICVLSQCDHLRNFIHHMIAHSPWLIQKKSMSKRQNVW